jgi:hypothetical protein
MRFREVREVETRFEDCTLYKLALNAGENKKDERKKNELPDEIVISDGADELPNEIII